MTLGSMSATDPSLVTSAAMEQTFASTRATAAAADGKPLPPDEQSGELAAMSLPRLFHWRRCIGAGWVLGTVLLWAQAPAQSPQPARPALRGATSKQVLELYGPPTSRMQAGTKEFFIYPHGGRIGFQAGIVTDVTLPLPPEIKRTPEVKTLLPPPPKLPADALTNSADKAPADPIAGMWDGVVAIGGLVLVLGALGGLLALWQKRAAQKAPTLKERFAKAQEIQKPVTVPGGGPAPAAAAPTVFTKKMLEELEWHYLELLVISYFDKTGFVAKRVKAAPDGAVDFLLYRRGDEKPAAYVQCKASPAFRIGPKAVRELMALRAEHHLSEGHYITSNAFTLEALALATDQNLILMSGADLLAKIEGLPPPDRACLLKEMTTGDPTTPTCPNCNVKMVRQNGDKPVWTCRNAPRCEIKMALGVATN